MLGGNMLSNNQSMVIRNSNSLNSIAYNKSKMQVQSHTAATNANAGQMPSSSKSVLTSFRNGPVKVLNSAASSGQIGQIAQRVAGAGAGMAAV